MELQYQSVQCRRTYHSELASTKYWSSARAVMLVCIMCIVSDLKAGDDSLGLQPSATDLIICNARPDRSAHMLARACVAVLPTSWLVLVWLRQRLPQRLRRRPLQLPAVAIDCATAAT